MMMVFVSSDAYQISAPTGATIILPDIENITVNTPLIYEIVVTEPDGFSAGAYDCYIQLHYINGSVRSSSRLMTQQTPYEKHYITYSAGNFSRTGDYYVYVVCEGANYGGAARDTFYVGNYTTSTTPSASTGLTLVNGLLYIFGVILLFILMGIIYFLSTKLPSRDAMDEQGRIIQVNWLKNLRPMMWLLNLAILISIFYITSSLCIVYLGAGFIGDYLFAIFRILFIFMIIMIPLYTIWFFIRIIEDKEMKRLIERGVPIGGKSF